MDTQSRSHSDSPTLRLTHTDHSHSGSPHSRFARMSRARRCFQHPTGGRQGVIARARSRSDCWDVSGVLPVWLSRLLLLPPPPPPPRIPSLLVLLSFLCLASLRWRSAALDDVGRRTTDGGKRRRRRRLGGLAGTSRGGRGVGRALRYTQLRKVRAKCCLLPFAYTHTYITTHRYTHTCLPLGAVVDSSKPSWGRSGPTGVAWTAVEGRSRECAWVVGHKPHGRITWSLWQYFGASGAPRGTVPGVLGSILRPSKSIGSEKASSSNMYGFHNF